MGVKPKKKLYKKWWFWVIAIFVIGAIGSSLNTEEPKKVDESKQTIATNTDEKKKDNSKKDESKKEETKGPKIFNVGDTVELGKFKITVNKVYEVKGNDFAKPAEGNMFLAIDCTVENISDNPETISSIMMFKVVDQDGRTCEYSLLGQTAAKAGQLDGEIAAGRKITGVYVVEVPNGKTGLELVFDSSLLPTGQVIVKLN